MEERFGKIIGIVVSFVILSLIGMAFLSISFDYKLEFYLNDEDLIDGDIYLNGIFMGSTNNGLIKMSEDEIEIGELTFIGINEKGENYSVIFEMYEEDYSSYYINFNILPSQLSMSEINVDDL